MGKMDIGSIKRAIYDKIKKDYKAIDWKGMQQEKIDKLSSVQIEFSSHYEGKKEYSFSGSLEFFEKNDEGTLSQCYRFYNPKAIIKEGEDGPEIELIEPMLLLKTNQ